jgi:hypothetical protein
MCPFTSLNEFHNFTCKISSTKYHRDHCTVTFGHALGGPSRGCGWTQKSTIETILLLPLGILLEAQIGGVDGPALGIKGRPAVWKRGRRGGGTTHTGGPEM